jgi:hypothetical protein
MSKHLVYARSPEWAALIERAQELTAGPYFSLLKDNGKTTAGLLNLPGRSPVFLKRVAVASWTAGLLDRLRGSRAARSVKGAALLKEAGFARPEPLAALEVRTAGVVRASYLLSEALSGARVLSAFSLAGGQRNLDRLKRISDTVAREVRRLHDSGLYTRDMQDTNLMLEEDEGALRIYFIDLEDFRRLPAVPWRLRRLNLVHLDRSVGRFVGRACKLRFLYGYLGGRPERPVARRIIAGLLKLRDRLDRRGRRGQGLWARGRRILGAGAGGASPCSSGSAKG